MQLDLLLHFILLPPFTLMFILFLFYFIYFYFIFLIYFLWPSCVYKLQAFRVIAVSDALWRSSLSRGTIWSHSPLWVWVAVVLPFPDPNQSFLMSMIHWVWRWRWWWWWWWWPYIKKIIRIMALKFSILGNYSLNVYFYELQHQNIKVYMFRPKYRISTILVVGILG